MIKKKYCEWCGAPFDVKPKGQHKKFCSTECYTKAHNFQRNNRRNSDPRSFARGEMAQIRTGGLDRTLKEAKEKGLTFAELQKQKTLAMVRKNDG